MDTRADSVSQQFDVLEVGERAGSRIASLFDGEQWKDVIGPTRAAGSVRSEGEVMMELAYLALHAFSTAMILNERISDDDELGARCVAFAELQDSGVVPVTHSGYDQALHRFNVNGQTIEAPREAKESKIAAAFSHASLVYLVESRDAAQLSSGAGLHLWNVLAGIWLRQFRWWQEHLHDAPQQSHRECSDLLARFVVGNVVVGRAGENIVAAADIAGLNSDRQLVYAETTMLALWAAMLGFVSESNDSRQAITLVRDTLEKIAACSTWRVWVTQAFSGEDLWKVFEVRLQQYGQAVKQMEVAAAATASASKAAVAYAWGAGAILIHHLSRFAEKAVDLGDPTPEADKLLNEAAACFCAGFANGMDLGRTAP